MKSSEWLILGGLGIAGYFVIKPLIDASKTIESADNTIDQWIVNVKQMLGLTKPAGWNPNNNKKISSTVFPDVPPDTPLVIGKTGIEIKTPKPAYTNLNDALNDLVKAGILQKTDTVPISSTPIVSLPTIHTGTFSSLEEINAMGLNISSVGYGSTRHINGWSVQHGYDVRSGGVTTPGTYTVRKD